MSIYRTLIGLVVLLFGLLSGYASPLVAHAQGERPQWSEPVNLSQSETSSKHPAIIADDFGNIHVFWSEDVGGQPLDANDTATSGNTIMYTKWDGQNWSKPTDVIFIPGDDLADFMYVDIDSQNILHAVWSGITNIYYSNVPVNDISNAQAWTSPVTLTNISARSGRESAVQVDANGVVHIIYTTRPPNPGIYHISSDDGGVRFSPPQTLSSQLDTEETGFTQLRLVADDQNRLHATWASFGKSGFNQAVYYARSTDGGLTWSAVQQLAYRDADEFDTGWPYLTPLGGDELLVIYNDESVAGRYQRASHDGGITWDPPVHVIQTMEGINGYNIPIVDSVGNPHLVVNLRTREGQVVGIYAAERLGSTWTEPYPVDTDQSRASSAHYAAAAMRNGNDLHIVWTQLRSGEIWHTHGQIASAPELPTATPGAATSAPTATLAPEPSVTSEPTAIAPPPSFDPTQRQPMSSSFPILAGALAAVTLILSVVIWRQAQGRRY